MFEDRWHIVTYRESTLDLWGNLRNSMYSNNSQILDEFKDNICETVAFVKVSELSYCRSFQETWSLLRADGRYFEDLLSWWVLLISVKVFTSKEHSNIYNLQHVSWESKPHFPGRWWLKSVHEQMVIELDDSVLLERLCLCWSHYR